MVMNLDDKKCACKGIRKCLLCEHLKSGNVLNLDIVDNECSIIEEFKYCDQCGNRAYLVEYFQKHYDACHYNYRCENLKEIEQINRKLFGDQLLNSVVLPIDGVFLQRNIINQDEELELVSYIDSRFDWIDSQSGRRKQDFGPKINFKKKKLNFTNFFGLPTLDMKIFDKIKEERLKEISDFQRFDSQLDDCGNLSSTKNVLNNFQTVEVCHLEYCPERGSSIDPHYDDFWIWGERLITLNFVSSTVITLTQLNQSLDQSRSKRHLIRIDLPARSILALYGDSRYRYQHSIRRSDIVDRRLAITYRELPGKFMDQSTEEWEKFGKEFLEKAKARVE